MRTALLERSLPPIEQEAVELGGGLDLVTPTLKLKPGVVTAAVNFECAISGGYTRIAGYERFDGRAKPSAALYSLLQLETFTNIPVVGTTLTGQTSGTTGTIIAVGVEPGGGTERNYIIVTLIVGTGFVTEVVNVGATTIGTLISPKITLTPLENAQYLNKAADIYRAFITAPAGSGPIRGIFSMINAGVHEVFCFRDNAGATASVLYKSTSSGWAIVPYLYEISFTAGGALAPADGATLTQGANTALIKRVMLQTGAWIGSTATGRLIIAAPAPGNFAAGAATITGGITVTLSGIQTAITMAPAGKFEFDIGNFSGQLASRRIYGCDRVNRCFEFDGVILAPITTGLTTDAPTHLRVHQNHLFISYGSSLLHSGIGTPFNWTALAGAAEYAVGDTVNGMKVLPGDQSSPSMAVGCGSTYKILYGSSAGGSDVFRLVSFNTETGMSEYSPQNLDALHILDDRGVMTLRTAQEFGNFDAATITYPLQPLLQEKRSRLAYSCVNKAKSQYRLFFSDGSGLYITIVNGKCIGSMPVQYVHPVACVWNGELANGNEVTYMGGANGTVYQLDIGSSCDGDPIEFSLTPNWNASKTPRIRKRYRRASLEVQGNSYAALMFEYLLGYGTVDYVRQAGLTYETGFSGAPRWDSGISWDSFTWDGQTIGPVELTMSGTAENIQPKLSGSSDIMFEFTINSLILHYTKRRALR